jgi:ABC-type lipoprotein export system ATPase subunit
VAIARALANNPPLILADEPTGNLDSESGHTVLEALQTIRRESNTTIILVTHDPELAAVADRTLTLVDGQLVNGVYQPYKTPFA